MPSPFDKAIRHAQETARHGGTVADCGYKAKAWRQVWLNAFQDAQQQELFNNNEPEYPAFEKWCEGL